MTPFTITRTTDLAAPLADSWTSIGTAGGLARWLGTDFSVEGDDAVLTVGSVATVADDRGAVRRLVVTDVDEGHRIGFTWWAEGAPALASQVTLTVEADGTGSTLTTTETIDSAAFGAIGARASTLAPTSVADLAGTDLGWGRRVDRLARSLEPALAPAGM